MRQGECRGERGLRRRKIKQPDKSANTYNTMRMKGDVRTSLEKRRAQ